MPNLLANLSPRQLGTILGGIGILATLVTWAWPRPEAPSHPTIYSLRVQTTGPDGIPIQGAAVRVSAGSEPQRLPDGWWEIEIPAAKVPVDRQITVWAEHSRWNSGKSELELGNDPNPRIEIRLEPPTSRLHGLVLDQDQRALEGAKVTVMRGRAPVVVTSRDGTFTFTLKVKDRERVRIHVEHKAFRTLDTFCWAGSHVCSIELEPIAALR